MKKSKVNFEYRDERGVLIEVWRSRRWRQMNYFLCKKGHIRGGHYHKKTKELFFVVDGKCEIALINAKTHKKKRFVADYKDVFIVEPYEAHYVKGIEDTKIIALLDKVHNVCMPDIHEYEK